ncbi:MAG: helix-hairpin-helix domain-containing protein [Thermoguttaceae bacterium]|jgi:competence protein ComEA|nr:helix-hairpin-helix domain-containing protein [Thermoguttaceae bacterium]
MAQRNIPRQNAVQQTPYWLLRRADQATVAALVLLALGAMILWWMGQGGLRGRRIELGAAEPLQYQFQVDLNSAPWQELVLLPGVGETLAMRIIESRETDGPFADTADLLRVRGIGPATLERLRPYLAPLAGNEQLAGDIDSPKQGDG